MKTVIRQKLSESLKSIIPIAGVVFFLSITITPMEPGTFIMFLLGVMCLIFGLAVFTVGAEMSMQLLGSRIGASLASSKKLFPVAFVSFLIGVFITISEPDLQILAEQVSGVPNMVLILTVSVGVGVFLVIAILHILLNIRLSVLLIIFYGAVFILSIFVPADFWSIAFDSGGVTTGPMTVPFIMSFGAGVSAVKSAGNRSEENSFGLVALCSIGPILSVMILGICYALGGSEYEAVTLVEIADTKEGITHYLTGFSKYMAEVGVALFPIIVFTVLFQIVSRAFSAKQLIRIAVGVVYTFLGLAVFLTGANEGFMPTGYSIGEALAGIGGGELLIPVSMLIGYFIVNAEPAVYVLNKQVEQISAGAISRKVMSRSLSIGVAAALGLSMLRIVTGISIMWILVPGYLIALGLTFLVPKFFTGIAFDSGGVASGAMMSAFVLPIAIGAASSLGCNIMTQAFGCVSFVALTPIISIQICGLIFKLKARHAVRRFVSEKETFIEYDITEYES